MNYSPADQITLVERDARYQDIGELPSRFIPYTKKRMMIRPFTVKEMRLVSKAAVLKEMVHLFRAVDLVIDQPVLELTIGDFYYVLMWLRIHSMPKTPYIIEWHCGVPVLTETATRQRLMHDDPLYNLKMENVESLAATHTQGVCDTHNSEVVHLSTVDILSLEDNFVRLPVLPQDPGCPTEGLKLDFPRVKILSDLSEALTNPELRYVVTSAQWMAGETLAARIEALETQPDLELFDLAAELNTSVVHGIRERVITTCRGCAIRRPHVLSLDAFSFFR